MFITIYEAEAAIQTIISKDNNCSAHFNYEYGNCEWVIELVTYNPTNNTHFLLHTLSHPEKLVAINNMYKHIFELKESLKRKIVSHNSYTVDWYSKPQSKRFISYFYGYDMQEVLNKFYYNKLAESFIIHSIKLNPLS